MEGDASSLDSLIKLWDSSANSTFAASSGNVTGLVCSSQPQGERSTKYCVRTDEHPAGLYISVPNENASAQVMDRVLLEECGERTSQDGRVFWNARSAYRASPWNELVQNLDFMGKEQVPLPLPEPGKRGNPFLLYSGNPSSVAYPTQEGLFRKITEWECGLWKENTQRRLVVHFEQRQWNNIADAAKASPLRLKLVLWDNHCNELPFGDNVNEWKALLQTHHIPFYAVCQVKPEAKQNDVIPLTVMAVRWEFSKYLVEKGEPATLEQAKQLSGCNKINKSWTGSDLVRISSEIPVGDGWSYHVLRAAELKLVFAIKLEASAATSAPKKSKK